MVHFIVSRLDHHLREQWELKQGASTIPATLPQLREFLMTRARALESMDAGKTSLLNRSPFSSANSSRAAKGTAPAKAMLARAQASMT